MSFSNQKQSIPELFKEKMHIDGSIQSLLKVASGEHLSSIDKWHGFKKVWKETKERQAELRAACEKYIGEMKKS